MGHLGFLEDVPVEELEQFYQAQGPLRSNVMPLPFPIGPQESQKALSKECWTSFLKFGAG